jgi:hypothetical protein
MVQDYSKLAMRAYLETQNRRRAGGGGKSSSKKKQYKIPFIAGKTWFRILPFTHRVTEEDIFERVGSWSLGLTEDLIGKEVELYVVPVTRFIGNKMTINGTGEWDTDIALQRWVDDKQNEPRPQDGFVCNVLCMDAPEHGVIQHVFSRADWIGKHNNQQERLTYGISNLFLGYYPEMDQPQDEGDDDGSGLGGLSGQVALDPLDPFDTDQIVGFTARDIGLVKGYEKIGSNNALVLDHNQKGGPIRVRRQQDSIEIDEAKYGQGKPEGVRDLLAMPAFFPGRASDGNHQTEAAYEFCLKAAGKPRKAAPKESDDGESPGEAQRGADEGDGNQKVTPPESHQEPAGEPEKGPDPEGGTEPDTSAEQQQATQEPESAPNGETGRRKRRTKGPGSRVKWKDEETKLHFVGTIDADGEKDGEPDPAVFTEDGEKLARLLVQVEEQTTPEAQQEIEDLYTAHGPEAVAIVPFKDLKLI